MSHIKYGEYRHSDANYDVYFRGAFQKMYGLTIEDGFWLGKSTPLVYPRATYKKINRPLSCKTHLTVGTDKPGPNQHNTAMKSSTK